MPNFAVIDTETNWCDAVMSIGVVIADENALKKVTSKYYIITPESLVGGMYSNALWLENKKHNAKYSRAGALDDMRDLFSKYSVNSLFAYNASFDYNHLPELSDYSWYDIMRIAAYRQYNHKIPTNAECFKTGRLKRNYGVESIFKMLSGDLSYCESHNALTDALDELKIMKLLKHKVSEYIRINK